MEDSNNKWLRKQVGEKIRQVREELDLSQGDLGTRLGVANSLVSRYERGAAPIPRARLEQIARLAGKEVAWFYGVEHPEIHVSAHLGLEVNAVLQEAFRKANMAFVYLLSLTPARRQNFEEDLKAGTYAPLDPGDLKFCTNLAMNDPNVPVWALVLHLRQVQEIRRAQNHGK